MTALMQRPLRTMDESTVEIETTYSLQEGTYQPNLISCEIPNRVHKLLTAGELILDAAKQSAWASLFFPDYVIVTTRRILICRLGVFGSVNFVDHLWQDVADVRVDAGMVTATVVVTAKCRKPDDSCEPVTSTCTGLEKQPALQLYAKAQEIEQQWREKQRLRKMEEDRAKVGGIYMQTPFAMPNVVAGITQSAPLQSVEERLARLKRLIEQGLITDAEYEARKAQIISEL